MQVKFHRPGVSPIESSPGMKLTVFWVIFAAILAGIFFPAVGHLRFLVPWLVAGFLTLNFLRHSMKWADLLRREYLITVFLAAVLLPALSWLGSGYLPPDQRTGLLLVALAPAGIIMLVLGRLIPGHDDKLILGNFFLMQFLIILYGPLWIGLLTHRQDISVLRLSMQSSALVLGPYALARLFTRVLKPAHTIKIIAIGEKSMVPMIFFIIASTIAPVADRFTGNPTHLLLFFPVMAVYLTQGGLALVLSRTLIGRNVAPTMAMICSSRNIQFMMAVGILNFSEETMIPMVMGVFCHHINNFFWLTVFRRKDARKPYAGPDEM